MYEKSKESFDRDTFSKMVDKYNCLQSRAEINLGLINRGDWRNWLQLSLKFDKQSFQESFYS